MNTTYRGFTEAQARAHRKYISQFVEIKVRMKAEERDTIKTAAAGRNQSVNAFVLEAIRAALDKA